MKRVAVNGEELACWRLDSSAPSAHLLVLHGAGQGSAERYRAICTELAKQGISSTRFDFSGHGESSAHLPNSLAKRLAEALHMLRHECGEQPLYILAASMSGEIAVRLADLLPDVVRGLVLIAPAVYAEEAWTVPFGPDFSAVIRRDQSWRSSYALSVLGRKHPPVLLLTPLDDAVIPHAVTEAILEQGAAGGLISQLELRDTGHAVGVEAAVKPHLMQMLTAAIREFVRPD
jgi:alpha-beta hydrolase superfamily lysophospholipase